MSRVRFNFGLWFCLFWRLITRQWLQQSVLCFGDGKCPKLLSAPSEFGTADEAITDTRVSTTLICDTDCWMPHTGLVTNGADHNNISLGGNILLDFFVYPELFCVLLRYVSFTNKEWMNHVCRVPYNTVWLIPCGMWVPVTVRRVCELLYSGYCYAHFCTETNHCSERARVSFNGEGLHSLPAFYLSLPSCAVIGYTNKRANNDCAEYAADVFYNTDSISN